MEDFLVQLAPDLLDGVQPGRIGRQRHQRELAAPQPGEQFGMPMHRPVIVDEKELRRLRV